MAQSFPEFFGKWSGGDNHSSDDSQDYAFHLELQHSGKQLTFVAHDGFLHSFMAIIKREEKTKVERDHGIEEIVTRKVSFPANDETGRERVDLFQEVRIGTVAYQVREYTQKGAFWNCILHRANTSEMSRPRRRGGM